MGATVDWIDKLERAKRLLDAGALTPEEFEAEKAKLLPQVDVVDEDSEPLPLLRKTRRAVDQTPKLIALGVVGVACVGLAAWYYLGRTPQPSVINQDLVADLATGPVVPTTRSQAPITSPVTPAASPSQCSDGELKVEMPGIGRSGTVVVNYPLDDTDAMGGITVPAGPFICISSAQLSRFATPSNDTSMASDVLVSFSPTGGGRGSLDYSVLFCSELPDTPLPPRNMKIGAFKWLGRAAAPAVTVRWYPDYRKHIESTCFCDDGGQAPCAVAETGAASGT